MKLSEKRLCREQSGTTLIEILVAIVVFSIGLAGTAAITINNIKTTSAASTRSQAVILADQFAEIMRANLAAYEAADFSVDPESTETVCWEGVECASDVQAQFDITAWKAEVARLLPAGVAFICTDSTPDDGIPGELACDGAGTNVIKMFWLNTRFVDEEQIDGSDFRRLVVPVIP